MATPLNKVLRCFGFSFVPITGNQCDIEVRTGAAGADEAPAMPFLFLEGKESCKLPRRYPDQPDLWADLCLFGFATKIARTICPNKAMEKRRLALASLLGLKDIVLAKTKATTWSPMVGALLSSPPLAQIPSVAARVIAQLNLKMIEPTDAVFLWGAVMQACHYSVSKKRNRSIVVSARMFWYIELETTAERKCTVKISDAYVYGSQYFMRTLVAFLLRTQEGIHELDRSQLREWQRAPSLPNGGAGATMPAPSPSSDNDGEEDTKPAAQPEKRH